MTAAPWRRIVTGLAAIVVLAACSDTGAAARRAASRTVATVDPSAVPADLGGLSVRAEATPPLDKERNAFVDQVGLFGLRQGELLQATLQLSRFNPKARVDTDQQRASLVNRVGGGASRPERMGDTTVYFTSAAKQLLAVWVRGRWLFVLSVREEYPTPRTLVRDALDVKP